MDSHQNSCSALIKQINDLMEKNANNTLRTEDLTMSQIGVLIALDQAYEKTLSMKELKEHFAVSQPTMFGTVRRLEMKKLVTTHEDPEDGRAKLVRLTDAGKEKCDSGYVHMDNAEEQLLNALDKEEREHFRVLLEKIRLSLK